MKTKLNRNPFVIFFNILLGKTPLRNCTTLKNTFFAKRRHINLEYWQDIVNIGDCLAEPILDFMCDHYNLDKNKKVKHTKHLTTVGSIFCIGDFDRTVWGSGIHTKSAIRKILKKHHKYDVRAVRGPLTRLFVQMRGGDLTFQSAILQF